MDIPNTVKKKCGYYHLYGEYCISISKEDVLNKCTRGLCKSNDTVLVGVSGSNSYLGFVSGENWGRAIIGAVNTTQGGKIIPAFFKRGENYVQSWESLPKFHFNFERETEDMNEDEKKIMRSWWNAYITQQAKKGQGVDPDHKEEAEKYLQ